MKQNQHSMKEKIQYRYMSASLALAELKELGYTIDYNVEKEQIKRDTSNFDITYIYRYEGDSNPDDESIVYGIKTESGEKGVFVAGFSPNSESDAAQVLRAISIKEKKQ